MKGKRAMKSVFYVFGIISFGVVSVSCTTICSSPKKKTVEFVHAEGEEKGLSMVQLPVFTPQSGIGKGPPIYDCPSPDLSFNLPPTTAAGIRFSFVRYLGGSYALAETAPNSRTFTNSTASLTLLSDTLTHDPDEQEGVCVSVAIPTLGITNAVYPCVETTAGSNVFENETYGLIFSKDTLAGTAHLNLATQFFWRNADLTETVAGSDIFTNENCSVRLTSTFGGRPSLVITQGILTNAIFSVWETAPQSGIYRNYHEPIQTDLDPEYLALSSFVPWQLKIGGITDTSLVTQASITTLVDTFSQITFSVVGDSLLSDQKFILIPDEPLEIPPPQGYVAIRTDTLQSRWWDENQKNISVQVTFKPLEKKGK